jgi:actin-related protein 6
VTPLLNGKPVHEAVRRLDVGGKHMTNYLIELLAIHEVSLTEDPWIANEVKEACCYVTDDFKRDMEKTWRSNTMDTSVVVDVQLPDYQEFFKAIVKPYEAKTTLRKSPSVPTIGNERFQVPEIVFDPGDIGMTEAGLPELIMQSIALLPEALQPAMLSDIKIVGGNAQIPGFVKRL